MKKLILLVLACVFWTTLFAQWTTSAPNIYYNSGNVGIGSTSGFPAQLNLSDPGVKLSLGRIPADRRANLGWASAYIGFQVWENTSGGWTAMGDGTHNGGAMMMGDPFGNFALLTVPHVSSSDQTFTSAQLASRARFAMNATGNVGIGNDPKSARTALEVRVDGNNSTVSSVLTLSQTNPGSPNNSSGVALDFSLGNNSGNNNIEARIAVKETYWGSRPKMTFNLWDASNAMKERMVITHDGNVGIGQASPANKLEVNGVIRSKEVRVEASTWDPADYVFKKDYNLLPLSDLEKYIAAHSHLPEIPSAAEIKENGLALGEMENLLLKKIEELTLYIIEQQKKIDALERRVDERK